MKQHRPMLVAAFTLLACAASLSAQDSRTLTFTNGEVISIDRLQRTMVIRNTQGKEQTVQLDDQLAGFGDVKAGDQVVLSLQSVPGRDVVRNIARSTTATTTPVKTSAAVADTTRTTAPDIPSDAAVRSYADRVAAMAQQANQVDRIWSDFRTACTVTVNDQYESAREWVSLWDEQARMDVSSGSCRDLFNQVIAAGETVNAGMAAAEESARKANLAPGTVREIRRRYSMDWDGWGRTAPERLEQ